MINIKIFGLDFAVSIGFIGMVSLMHYIDKTGLMLPTFGAVLIHETGHIAAMKILKCPPKKITLKIGAASIEANWTSGTRQEILIALAGPFVNLAFFLIFLAFNRGVNSVYLLKNALTMLVVGVFNLFPVKGLDGGTILRWFLMKTFNLHRAETILKIVSVLVGVAILIAGLYIFVKQNHNPSLILLSVYLLFTAMLKI